jgi:hypothetical protein
VPRKIMRGGQAAADRAGLHPAIEAGSNMAGSRLSRIATPVMYSYSQRQ